MLHSCQFVCQDAERDATNPVAIAMSTLMRMIVMVMRMNTMIWPVIRLIEQQKIGVNVKIISLIISFGTEYTEMFTIVIFYIRKSVIPYFPTRKTSK